MKWSDTWLALIGAIGLIALVALADFASVQSQDDQQSESVRVFARLRDSGAIEFGLRTAEGNQFPRQRFFPANIEHHRWLRSTAIRLPDDSIVYIIARRNPDTRVEFGVRTREPRQEYFPRQRFFPNDARVDRWLISSSVSIPVAVVREVEQEQTEPPTEPPAPEPQPEPEPKTTTAPEAEEPDQSSDNYERISGGHRDGLIVIDGVLGDPDAPVLISEYGDPF